jgi:hypothetical protein
MHFEVPKAKTLKEFGGEYLMIVISILTALALEQGAQALHHHEVAHEASVKIDAEIRANIEEVASVRAHNAGERDKLGAIKTALLADIRGGMADELLKKRVLSEYKDAFNLSIQTPTLRREAWEVAVANQAVSWMAPGDMKRYSLIYASMRDIQSLAASGGNYFVDGPRMRDTASNAQMGLVDPREVYRMLNQIISSYGSINGNLAILQEQLEKGSSQSKAGH